MIRKFSFLLLLPFILTACEKFDPAEQAILDEEVITQYIADNNLNAQSTGSGLYYVLVQEGIGTRPTLNSNVKVIYKGYLTDGTVFDQSPASGVSFPLAGVIEGWREGIPLFREGGEGILLIPSGLGYGNTETGSIPANSVLIFDIELLDVQ
jgi:FKBP-type peptidyl-prolyl cis-trans isomerase FkpA